MPGFAATRPGVLAYRWPGASKDFGYPFDLSSSVYRTADIEPILRHLGIAGSFDAIITAADVRALKAKFPKTR